MDTTNNQNIQSDSPAPLWPDILLPKNFTIENSAHELTITYRWFGQRYIVTAVIGLIWTGVTFFIFQDTSFGFFLICPHSWVGPAMLYYAVAGFFNSTVISVTPKQLTVAHRPLPYYG